MNPSLYRQALEQAIGSPHQIASRKVHWSVFSRTGCRPRATKTGNTPRSTFWNGLNCTPRNTQRKTGQAKTIRAPC
jgi:hypothetical protein